jgi:chromosome segregation ATPase
MQQRVGTLEGLRDALTADLTLSHDKATAAQRLATQRGERIDSLTAQRKLSDNALAARGERIEHLAKVAEGLQAEALQLQVELGVLRQEKGKLVTQADALQVAERKHKRELKEALQSINELVDEV